MGSVGSRVREGRRIKGARRREAQYLRSRLRGQVIKMDKRNGGWRREGELRRGTNA